MDIKLRGIYEVKNENNELMYIGSSGIPIDRIEFNHRNYQRYSNGKKTLFRETLGNMGENWMFEWRVEPHNCSTKEIETLEGIEIRKTKPKYNKDMDPVASSIRFGRYV